MIASHLISSDSTFSPPGPNIFLYIASTLAGSSFTSHFLVGSLIFGEKGAFIAGGVYDHLGLSFVSVVPRCSERASSNRLVVVERLRLVLDFVDMVAQVHLSRDRCTSVCSDVAERFDAIVTTLFLPELVDAGFRYISKFGLYP